MVELGCLAPAVLLERKPQQRVKQGCLDKRAPGSLSAQGGQFVHWWGQGRALKFTPEALGRGSCPLRVGMGVGKSEISCPEGGRVLRVEEDSSVSKVAGVSRLCMSGGWLSGRAQWPCEGLGLWAE